MNKTPILDIHQDSLPLSLQQQILDSVIDYAMPPLPSSWLLELWGAGILLWYFRRRSDLGKPSLGDSKPKSSPIVSVESKSEAIGSQTPFVDSPFEQSIKDELSAFIGLFEYLSVDLAAPAFLCMLVLLALVLRSKDRIVALLFPLSHPARSLQRFQYSH